MKLIIYRVLSFLLLPMALLFSLIVLMLIRAAFANPVMFAPLFLLTCISIYTFCSLNFLIRGIDGQKFLGRSSKDWLKVNAYVSIVYAVGAIAEFFLVFFNPEQIDKMAGQLKQNAGDDIKITTAQFSQYIYGTSCFLLIYGCVLLIHIILSLTYVRKYNYLFQNEKS
jgi:hypothetical protein